MVKNYKDFFSILNLDALPDDKKEKLLEKAADLIQKRVFLRLVDGLSEKETEEMAKIFSIGSNGEKEEFFKRHAADFEKFVAEETARFKWEIRRAVDKEAGKDALYA